MTPILSIHVGEVNSSRCILGKAKLISCLQHAQRILLQTCISLGPSGDYPPKFNMQQNRKSSWGKLCFGVFQFFMISLFTTERKGPTRTCQLLVGSSVQERQKYCEHQYLLQNICNNLAKNNFQLQNPGWVVIILSYRCKQCSVSL